MQSSIPAYLKTHSQSFDLDQSVRCEENYDAIQSKTGRLPFLLVLPLDFVWGGVFIGKYMKKVITYNDIICLENIHRAWLEFLPGKKHKNDVAEFSLHLSQNIYTLHLELKNKTYTHGSYKAFKINDPKPRDIHKTTVRDRLLHHAIYQVLYLYFEKDFIYDSYSCRDEKGTHKAVDRFQHFARKVSSNHRQTCWVLKCDIRKFFANIEHKILMKILERHIACEDTLSLLKNIIDSFPNGLPLGNLTSQLLVNVYMNEFDQYIKHVLKVKYYIRYADDFVVLTEDRKYLEYTLSKMKSFLQQKLKLEMHPDKVFIKTYSSGVDFLGWINFPTHKILRTSTKKRMLKKVDEKNKSSYLGMLKHGNTWKLRQKL